MVSYAIERSRLAQQVADRAVQRTVLSRLEARGKVMADLAELLDDVVGMVGEGLPRTQSRARVITAAGQTLQRSTPGAGPDPAGAAVVVDFALRGAEVDGELSVSVPSDEPLEEHERTFLQRVAELAADAIDAHAVAEDLTHRTRQLETLHSTARLLGSDPLPSEVAEGVADLLLAMVRPGGEARAVVEVDGATATVGSASGTVAALEAPVEGDGERVGSVRVGASRPRTWSSQDELVVDQIADLLAMWSARRSADRERRAARDDIDRERRRFEALFHQSRDGIVLADSDGRFLDANAAFCELVGRSHAEVVGSLDTDFLADAILDRDPAEVRQLLEGGAEVRGTVALDRPDGSRVELEYQSVAGVMGKLHLSIVRDVTEQRRAQRTLLANERRFRALAEQAVEGIFRLRLVPERRYEYVNPAFVRITGFDLDQLHEDHLLLRRRTHRHDVVQDTEDTPRRVRFLRSDGQWRWLEWRQAPQGDETGVVSVVQGLVLDVTEGQKHNEALEAALEREQEAGQQLRELADMKDAFLRAASHELRTPVAAAYGIAQTLLEHRDRLDADRVVHLLQRLEAQTGRLRSLLEDLLDLDRLTTAGVTDVRRESIDLAELAEEVVEDIAFGHRTLRLDLHPTPAEVDPAHLERIIHNLMANAVKHTPEGSSIWVTTQPGPKGAAVFTVDDDGPGIVEDLRGRIVSPFVQGPSAASDPDPGVGVGLTLVDHLARLHGGTLELDESPRGGLRARVTLPAADPVGGADRATRSPRTGASSTAGTDVGGEAGQTTSKRALYGISRSIESLARSLADQGEPVVLLGLFQDSEYLRHSEQAYLHVAGPGDAVVGYVGSEPHPSLDSVMLGPDSPLADEWTVLLLSPRVCAALVATDAHAVGPGRTIEDARLFRAVTSIEPEEVVERLRRVVRLAAHDVSATTRTRLSEAAASAGVAADDVDAMTGQRLREAWAALIARTDELQRSEPLAMTDPLTGAYSMGFLNAYLGRPSAARRLGPRSPSVVIAAFAVHQAEGPRAIDETARLFADTVRRHTSTQDLLVREDTDEWLLVLPGWSLDDAQDVVRAVLGSLHRQELATAEGAISAAAALAEYVATDVDLAELRAARDRARDEPGSVVVLDAGTTEHDQ